ncbi:MAG: hypothetical protein IT423_14955, partial [Pirellulaceae bacterium]|nr:hypothetical protein [Pirellulaceae bacterium]
AAFNGQAFAQNQARYEQIPPPAAAAITEAGKNINAALRETGAISTTGKDAIRVFIHSKMSRLTEVNMKEPPDRHRAAIETQIRQISSDDGSKFAAQTVVEFATKVISGNYLPASKINAMLLLVELDEGGRSGKAPAQAAFAPLVTYAKNSQVPCHLRGLALDGINRYVRVRGGTIPDTVREPLGAIMVSIIGSQPVVVQEEPAHWWMVRRSYEVLGSLHGASAQAKDKKFPPSLVAAFYKSLDQFLEPSTIPSVRINAGLYLTRFDFTNQALDKAVKLKMYLAISQLLDQEVVGWYEFENEKTKMASGASGMGGMGGMGMSMGGMPGGMDSGASDFGAMGGMPGGMPGGDGGADMMGAPGMGMGGTQNTGPKPIETQTWELRLARRKLNTYCQLAHVLLKGNAALGEKDFSASGKGLMEVELPEEARRPGKFLIEALEKVQEDINEKTLTNVGGMMTRLMPSLTALRDAAEMAPGLTEGDKVLVPTFDEHSPRKKSFKKADADGALDSPTGAAPPPAADAAAGAAPATPGDAANPAAAPGAPAAPGVAPAMPAAPAAATPAAPAAAVPAAAAAAASN